MTSESSSSGPSGSSGPPGRSGTSNRAGRSSGGSLAVVAILGLGVALALLATWGRPRLMLRPQEPTQGLALGSLPFANLSGDPELETLAHELSGSLEDALSTRSVGFAYRKSPSVRFPAEWEGDVEGFASSMDVDYVLAGSIDLESAEIRIDCFLVRPGARLRLWAESFRFPWDGGVSDAERRRIESEVTEHITRSLNDASETLARPDPKPFIP